MGSIVAPLARFLAWADLKEISYSEGRSWFVIRAVDGWKFRVPVYIPGLRSWLSSSSASCRKVP
jgi:hypothetical protein